MDKIHASINWDELLNAGWSYEVTDAFQRLKDDEKHAIAKYMPSVPVPRYIQDAASMLTPEEVSHLNFYAVAYQNRFLEPDFKQDLWVHRDQCQMLWNMTRNEIQRYMDAYVKYILQAKAETGMAMSREKREISNQINHMLRSDDEKKKAQKLSYRKDKFIHI